MHRYRRTLTNAGDHITGAVRASPWRVAWLSVAVVVWAAVYWYDVGYSLAVWDESIYAASARLVVDQGYVLVPHVQGGLGSTSPHPFLEKPPLVIWLEAVGIALFGPTEAAVRLQGQLFILGAAGVVYALGERLRSPRVGGLSAVVFLTTPQLFEGINGGRTAGTDPALLFFGSLALALVWIAVTESRDRLLVAAGVAGGLAAMSKGLAVGFYVLAGLPLGWLALTRCARRYLLAGLGAALVVGGWWPAVAWFLYGDLFWQEFVLTEVLQPGGSAARGVGVAYLRILPWAFGPWLYLLGPVGAALGYAVWQRGSDTEWTCYRWLWWWAVVVFVVVLLVGEHTWYVMPVYTPLAVLVGWGLSLAISGDRIARVAVVLGTVATLVFSYRTVSLHYGLVVATGGGAVAVAWSLRGIVADLRPPELKPVLYGLLVVSVAVGAILLTIPAFGSGESGVQRSLGTAADDRVDDGVLLVGPNVSASLFPLGFYSGARLERTGVAELRSGPPGQYVVLTNNTTQSLERPHAVVERATDGQKTWLLVQLA